MAAQNVNYNDDRFKTVEADKNAALKDSNATFDGMINQSDSFYNAQIDAAKQWGATQEQLQNERTDFTVEQINQQKEQTYKDYQKEQAGAYADWQKQSNDYGTNAERMAQSGLASSGYSESSQVAMYNQYQNRVATAREVYNRAVLNYDNAIKDARLQNNSALAEIAYNTLQQSLQLSLQGFQYKNDLINQKANAKRQIEDTYYSRYQDVVAQINHENSMAEQIRQYNQSMAFDKQKFAEDKRQYNQSLNIQKQQLAEEKRQYNKSLAEQKRQFNEELAWQKKKSNVSSTKKSSGGSGGTYSNTKKKNDKPKSNPKKNTKKSNDPPIDKKSVIALGYGPISAAKLDELEASGEIFSYKEDGKLKFKKKQKAFQTFLPKTAKKFGLK